ncbi:MAG: ABC transporter substrate-binding protein [Spirochaetota bacterium]
MKKLLVIYFCLMLLFTVSIVWGGGEKAEAPKKEVTLTLTHDKGGNPNFQPYFEAVGAKTKELFGIGITPVPYPTTDVYMAAVRSALPTEKAPDLFTWWSTYRMKGLIDQGLVADLTDVWESHKAEYSQGLRDAFTFNKKNYGFVYGVEYWPVWYNRDVFAKLNLKEPENWDEFINVCETLKANGVTPLFLTVQARWPTFIMFEEFIIGESPDLYVDLCEGRAKYSDPRVKKAFGLWADLMAKGYFTEPSADLFSDAPRLFNQDKLGMVVCGTWFYTSVLVANGVPESKIGAFDLPSHNPAAGKVIILEAMPILVAEKAPNREAAKKVVDWLMGPEGNAFLAEMITSFPANQKSKADYLPPVKVKLMDTIINKKLRIVNRYWEATPTPICETAVDKFAEFILNPGSVNKVLADLDRIADDYWAKQ